jgi:hypothetical protein
MFSAWYTTYHQHESKRLGLLSTNRTEVVRSLPDNKKEKKYIHNSGEKNSTNISQMRLVSYL